MAQSNLNSLSNFSIAQKFTAAAEGGLTDDPQDRGGITNYGVSLAFLTDLSHGSQADKHALKDLGIDTAVNRQTIIRLTKNQAEGVFKYYFWDSLKLDELPLKMGCLIYDAAVNHGRIWGVKLAQRGYNKVYPNESLVVDGKLGPKSRAALSSHDEACVHDAILDARNAYYDAIIKNRPSQKVFERGWKNRVKRLRTYLLSL